MDATGDVAGEAAVVGIGVEVGIDDGETLADGELGTGVPLG